MTLEQAAPPEGPRRDLEMFGYSNFLRAPAPEERSGHRKDPKSLERLSRLARVMLATTPLRASGENPGIPAGYTYLLQLVAHDCVHTPTPFWQIPAGRVAARNGRIARLRLDTLYGLGPFATPAAYRPDDEADTTRSRFRLGPTQEGVAERDIARIGCPADGITPKLTDPLICDPRNEDNAILAQVTALWHMIHNAFVELADVVDGSEAARETRFTWARAATTMVYRRMLRDDLLPRLLHPEVFARYAAMTDEAGLLNREVPVPESAGAAASGARGFARPKVSVPLEFSHGAMRFAHAMIRPGYRINGPADLPILGALRASSARKPARMPLDQSWIIAWSFFFDDVVPGQAPVNLSQRIRPVYNPALSDTEMFPGPCPRGGLPMHDLASAASAPLWSVGALYRAIEAKAGDRNWPEPFGTPQLTDDADRARSLAAWMAAQDSSNSAYRIFADGDIQALAADPPLPFYILFEAEAVHGGERLGPLGSILIAEVLFGAMLADPLPGEAPGASLPEALASLAASLGVAVEAARCPEHARMGTLIRFVAREAGLENACPAFL